MPVSGSDLLLLVSDGLFDNLSPLMIVLCIAEALHLLGNMPKKDLGNFTKAPQLLIPIIQEFKNFANENLETFKFDMLKIQQERKSFELQLKYKLEDHDAADARKNS